MFHITPMHYLPRILKTAHLLSKTRLIGNGYSKTHFRTTSRKADISRGFGNYIHLSLQEWPPILESKLTKGFPHVRLKIPSSTLGENFELCKYNIARTRKIRDGKSPAKENSKNGHYYDALHVLVVRLKEDQIDMMANCKTEMVEVLVKEQLEIDSKTNIQCFSFSDTERVKRLTQQLGCSLNIDQISPAFSYPQDDNFNAMVTEQIDRYISDTAWKGDGIDFDKLT